MPFRRCLILIAACSAAFAATTYTETWKSVPAQLTGDLSPYIDLNKGVLYLNGAEPLLRMTIGCNYDSNSRKPGPPSAKKTQLKAGTCTMGTNKDKTDSWDELGDSYFVIHLLRWKDVTVDAADNSKASPTVDSQHWYVYHHQKVWSDQDFTTAKRIFGKHRVWFLYVHINKPGGLAYSSIYEIQTTKKIPAYLDHLIQLAGLFGIKAPAAGGGGGGINVFGAQEFEIPYVPSDVKFTPQLTLAAPPPPVPGAPKPPNFGTVGSVVSGPTGETFDNEGKYRVDFSVGVPFTKISQLQYSDTNGAITAAKVDKREIYGFFNLYPVPVDLKRSGFSKFPHLVTGVAIATNPLKKGFVGIGYGPALANFYIGAMINTDRAPAGLACGTTPTPAQSQGTLFNRTCFKLGFGLNMGVGAVVNALKGTK